MVEIPGWVYEGASVRIPGGPLWKIAKVLVTPASIEVHVRTLGDDHPCAWHLDKFIAVWEPAERLTRFDREDPI